MADEFGVEAVFEQPSYQDLIVTPVGGALLGLAFEPRRNWIKRKPEPQWYGRAVLIAITSDVRVDVGRDSKDLGPMADSPAVSTLTSSKTHIERRAI